MPQNRPVGTLRVLNSSALQGAITLQNSGSLVSVGAPGGPVVAASFGAFIIPRLSGDAARDINYNQQVAGQGGS